MIDRNSLFFLLSSLLVINLAAQERIAILAYGSLVKRPKHSVTGARLCAAKFAPTPLSFPISLSSLAHKNRITAVIDSRYGISKRVWAAASNFNSFDHAIQNLAAREGAAFIKKEKKYDTQYIFYIRKLGADEILNKQERLLNKSDNWVIREDPDGRQRLSEDTIACIAEWAKKNKFDAVLWVSCPIVPLSSDAFIIRLLEDPVMLSNAQGYVKLFADGAQTELERAIIGGKSALMKLMRARKE